MANKPDGGPAFPSTTDRADDAHVGYVGMTLRQWYAGMAMQGILAGYPKTPSDKIIRSSFLMADAMITEDSK